MCSRRSLLRNARHLHPRDPQHSGAGQGVDGAQPHCHRADPDAHAFIDPSAVTAAEAVGGAPLLLIPAAIVVIVLLLGYWVFTARRRESLRSCDRLMANEATVSDREAELLGDLQRHAEGRRYLGQIDRDTGRQTVKRWLKRPGGVRRNLRVWQEQRALLRGARARSPWPRCRSRPTANRSPGRRTRASRCGPSRSADRPSAHRGLGAGAGIRRAHRERGLDRADGVGQLPRRNQHRDSGRRQWCGATVPVVDGALLRALGRPPMGALGAGAAGGSLRFEVETRRTEWPPRLRLTLLR